MTEHATRDRTNARAARPEVRPEREQERRERVLTQGAAATVQSIADALVTKEGPLFLVTEANGQVPLDDGHGFGLYFRDCRYLSGYELRLAGVQPPILAASDADGYRAVVQLSNPDLALDGATVPKETLGIRWVRLIDPDAVALRDVVNVANYGQRDIEVPLELRFRFGFEDVFAIRGLLNERPGALHDPHWPGGDVLEAVYEGADGRRRVVDIRFDRTPRERAADAASFRLAVPAGGSVELSLSISVTEVDGETDEPVGWSGAARPAAGADRLTDRLADACRTWRDERTSVESDSLVLDEIVARSLLDLRILRTRSSASEPAYFAAGVPWFVTLFGRDSIITALQFLAFDPGIAEGTLRLLAGAQGTKVNPWRDEEPGKILHELRIGELARLGEIPHTPYYGTVDATPLFLVLLAEHARWTGQLALFDELRDNVEQALRWIDEYGDRDGDGFVEYRGDTRRGLVNQGWKDSGDAIVDESGGLATPPIALVEVQAYVHRGKRAAADLYERAGDSTTAERLRREADELRDRFERRFWLEDEGIYELALQADGRGCGVVASNAGHALWAGIAGRERAGRTVRRLMAEDMFAGWGIRTLSARARRYNPVGYHLGTIWPHDNALIATGFHDYGFTAAAHRLFEGIVEAAMDFNGYRLPEALAGFSREEFASPVRYPVACHPQAWAAGAVPMMLVTLLGLRPDGLERRLRVVRPGLPSFADRLDLRGLRVAGATVDLHYERRGDRVDVEVVRLDGDLEVETEDGVPEPDEYEPRGAGAHAPPHPPGA